MPSSPELPGEFHDSCRPFYELLTSSPFDMELRREDPSKKAGYATSPRPDCWVRRLRQAEAYTYLLASSDL